MAELSLLQWATQMMEGMSADRLRAAYVATFAREHPMLATLPAVNIPGTSDAWQEEVEIGSPAFRSINASYTPTFSRTVQKSVPLKVIGDELDVDTALLKMSGEGVRAQQETMKVKAMSHKVGQATLHGDSDSDPNSFDGLQKIVGTSGDQVIDAGSTSGGDPLSLAKLDEAIARVDNPTHLVMNQQMLRRLSQASRKDTVGGQLEMRIEQFGMQIARYNGIPILVADINGLQYATLGFTEASPGGGSTGTSIYTISAGSMGVSLIQNAPPEVRDLGEIDSAPVMRTRFEWLCALRVKGIRSVSRLWGISDAAVVA